SAGRVPTWPDGGGAGARRIRQPDPEVRRHGDRAGRRRGAARRPDPRRVAAGPIPGTWRGLRPPAGRGGGLRRLPIFSRLPDNLVLRLTSQPLSTGGRAPTPLRGVATMTHADQGDARPDAGNPEEFVRLFTRYQRKLYWYIYALLHDPHDAEEVFQETAIVLWQ